MGLGEKKREGGRDPNAHYGNIYGNILKNTVALVMGQLLFLKRFRMQIPKVILDKRGLIFVVYI